MSNKRAEELIRKYLDGTATPEEEALLQSWYIEMAQDQPVMGDEPDYPKIGDEILQRLRAEQTQADVQPQPAQPFIQPPPRLWPRLAAAASVLIALSIGGFFIVHKKPVQEVAISQLPPNEMPPAGTRATLTLLDGKIIPVDSVRNGTLAQQGNATIRSLDGQLIYSKGQAGPQIATTAYNTLTTRPGEHYSLLLPDGTKVWLNAGSSITYPVAFNEKERKVMLTGEVYLEIAHNPRQPFRIAVKDQTIEDLGTRLNINAYDNEPSISTTLLEGGVRVMKGHLSANLTPGQQATLDSNNSSFRIKNVDAEGVAAWKDGYFYFDRADIKTVMREISRWYNVRVIYKGDLPTTTFKGKFYRNINASEALNILSYFGAHFRIEGNAITVSS